MGKAQNSGPISGPARMLLRRLEHQHADARPEKWEELLGHFRAELAEYASGPAFTVLEAEFVKVRDRTLANRQLRLTRHALANAAFTATAVGGDWETWTVNLVDGSTVELLAPTADDTDDDRSAATLARAALRKGSCPGCRKPLVHTSDGEITVLHKQRCPAAALHL